MGAWGRAAGSSGAFDPVISPWVTAPQAWRKYLAESARHFLQIEPTRRIRLGIGAEGHGGWSLEPARTLAPVLASVPGALR